MIYSNIFGPLKAIFRLNIKEYIYIHTYTHTHTHTHTYIYTGCNRRNVRDFGRVFIRSNYTNITQKTYIQSSVVTEKFETLTAITHLLITKYILKLAGICGFCNVNRCT